jgi:hypothetical protein
MMPLHFLGQEDVGYPLRRHFVMRRSGFFAQDERQARFFVLANYGFLSGRGRIRSKTFAEQIGHRVFELSPFTQGAEFHLFHQRIGQIKGCFHAAILLVSQLLLSTRRRVCLSI